MATKSIFSRTCPPRFAHHAVKSGLKSQHYGRSTGLLKRVSRFERFKPRCTILQRVLSDQHTPHQPLFQSIAQLQYRFATAAPTVVKIVDGVLLLRATTSRPSGRNKVDFSFTPSCALGRCSWLESPQLLANIGGRSRARTADLLLVSPVLAFRVNGLFSTT